MPFRASRSTRSGRPGAHNDDVVDGLPVRQWRQQEATVGITEEDALNSDGPQPQDRPPRDASPELPMPKGSEHYTPYCRELLRLARSGRIPRKADKPVTTDGAGKRSDSDKENAGHPSSEGKENEEGFGGRGSKRAAEQGFTALRWTQLSRSHEEPDHAHLAKRRKGLPSLHVVPDVTATIPMRKTKVKRVDADGQTAVFEVMVPEGQTVEGEIKEEVTLENAGAAIAAPKPGTFVAGLGVANEQGVVIADVTIAPLKRKGPPRKKKKKQGRWQQKLSEMKTGGVSASAEALADLKRQEQVADGKSEGDGQKEEQEGGGEDEEVESDEDGEEDDEDHAGSEEGEIAEDLKQDADADVTMMEDGIEGGPDNGDPGPDSSSADPTIPQEERDTASVDEEYEPPDVVIVPPNTSSLPADDPPKSTPSQHAQIPGLFLHHSSQVTSDAAKDVQEEPAPDRHVPAALETSAPAEGQGPPSSDSLYREDCERPNESNEATHMEERSGVVRVEEDTVMQEAANLPEETIERPEMMAQAAALDQGTQPLARTHEDGGELENVQPDNPAGGVPSLPVKRDTDAAAPTPARPEVALEDSLTLESSFPADPTEPVHSSHDETSELTDEQATMVQDELLQESDVTMESTMEQNNGSAAFSSTNQPEPDQQPVSAQPQEFLPSQATSAPALSDQPPANTIDDAVALLETLAATPPTETAAPAMPDTDQEPILSTTEKPVMSREEIEADEAARAMLELASSQSPQRPETEALTPEPEQIDVPDL